MKTFVLFLAGVACMAARVEAAPSTFDELLGHREVIAIVSSVTSEVVAQQSKALGRSIAVTEPYVDHVASLAGKVETEAGAEKASASLRDLYRTFAIHLVEYLSARSDVKAITLNEKAVARYLSWASEIGICGEVPCSMDCKPCSQSCNRCQRISG